MTANGIEEPSALVEAHRRALNNTSFTVVEERITRVNGTVVVRGTARARFSQSNGRYLFRSNSTVVNGSADQDVRFTRSIWSNETTTVRRVVFSDGTVQYEVDPPGVDRLRDAATGGERLRALFADGNATVESTVERNGTTLYEIVSTGRASIAVATENASNFTLTAYVAPSGVVREYTVTYPTTWNGQRARITERRRYVEIGSTAVRRPAWVTEATINETTASNPYAYSVFRTP
ncbi:MULTISPECIES: DUF7537 family lipoprotein [Halorussus]|uniref:DUF7537 family lipoprotein n=1 Tax=Halorussus sp. GCM10023401 TaxID=3252680 RepID=UPI00209CCC34|nr:hypothetical protein [Halorussus vallis]USZ78202.1 hypothetical protein NGM07_21330 [Halorussus vallis]